MNDTVTLVTCVAVGLALIDAMLFAASDTMQHDALSDKWQPRHLTGAVISVVKQRRWQAGARRRSRGPADAIAQVLAPHRGSQPVGVSPSHRRAAHRGPVAPRPPRGW